MSIHSDNVNALILKGDTRSLHIKRKLLLLFSVFFILFTVSFLFCTLIIEDSFWMYALSGMISLFSVLLVWVGISDSAIIQKIVFNMKQRESMYKTLIGTLLGLMITASISSASLSLSRHQVELAEREFAPNISITSGGVCDYVISCDIGVASYLSLAVVDQYNFKVNDTAYEITLNIGSELIDGQGSIDPRFKDSTFRADFASNPIDAIYPEISAIIQSRQPLASPIHMSRYIEIIFFDFQNNHVTYTFSEEEGSFILQSTQPRSHVDNNIGSIAQSPSEYIPTFTYLLDTLLQK